MLTLRSGKNAELAGIAMAEMARLCYTCGICVGDCPAARFSDDFNPRQIFLKVCLGISEGLEGETSPIWKCTTCYTCYERCPAGVKPLEVIIALRNLNFAKKTCPKGLESVRESVLKSGMVSAVTERIVRLRRDKGLPELKAVPDHDLGMLIGES